MGSPWGEPAGRGRPRTARSPVEVVDEQVRRVLRLAARVGALAGAPESVPPQDRPAAIDGAALARESPHARSCWPSNSDGMLPLDASPAGQHRADRRAGQGRPGARRRQRDRVPRAHRLPAGGPVRRAAGLGAGSVTRSAPTRAPASCPGRRTVVDAACAATFRDAAGATPHETPLATGAGRWMEMPPASAATPGHASRSPAGSPPRPSGAHQLGIRGLGRFTLAAPATRSCSTATIAAGLRRLREHLPGAARAAAAAAPWPPGADVEVIADPAGHPHRGLRGRVADARLRRPDCRRRRTARRGRGAPPRASDVAIVVVGTTEEVESEGFDRTDAGAARPPGRAGPARRGSQPAHRSWWSTPARRSSCRGQTTSRPCCWPGSPARKPAMRSPTCCSAQPSRAAACPTTWPAVAADCPVLSTTPVDGAACLRRGRLHRLPGLGAVGRRRRGTAFGHGLGYTTWELRARSTADARSGAPSPSAIPAGGPGARSSRSTSARRAPDDSRPRPLAGRLRRASPPARASRRPSRSRCPSGRFQIWDDGWRTDAGGVHRSRRRTASPTSASPPRSPSPDR